MDKAIEPKSGLVVALVADLIFESKIRATARAVGVNAVVSRSEATVESKLGQASALIVDLEGGAHLEFVRFTRSRYLGLAIIGFFPHVQAEVARQAKAAGVTRLLPRSKFTEGLGELLVELSTGPASQPHARQEVAEERVKTPKDSE